MVSAEIEEVFARDPFEPKYLSEDRREPTPMDAYRFHLSPKFTTILNMSKDPSDGKYYAVLLGLFIDGKEVQFTTAWIPNHDDDRDREYTLEVPKHPVSLMSTRKVHSLQFKVGERGVVWGIPQPDLSKREYDLAESPVYYYTIGKVEDGNNTGTSGSLPVPDPVVIEGGGHCGSK